MTSLIIHGRKFKNRVNIESKTENRVDIGSKRTKSIAKFVNSLIFQVKKTRFATVFVHRKIANFYPNRLNFFFKPRRNLRRTRISRLEIYQNMLTGGKSLPYMSFFDDFLQSLRCSSHNKEGRIEFNFFMKSHNFSRRIRIWPKKRHKLNTKIFDFFFVAFSWP